MLSFFYSPNILLSDLRAKSTWLISDLGSEKIVQDFICSSCLHAHKFVISLISITRNREDFTFLSADAIDHQLCVACGKKIEREILRFSRKATTRKDFVWIPIIPGAHHVDSTVILTVICHRRHRSVAVAIVVGSLDLIKPCHHPKKVKEKRNKARGKRLESCRECTKEVSAIFGNLQLSTAPNAACSQLRSHFNWAITRICWHSIVCMANGIATSTGMGHTRDTQETHNLWSECALIHHRTEAFY